MNNTNILLAFLYNVLVMYFLYISACGLSSNSLPYSLKSPATGEYKNLNEKGKSHGIFTSIFLHLVSALHPFTHVIGTSLYTSFIWLQMTNTIYWSGKKG